MASSPTLNPRALIPFPDGANTTDTLISGRHFNLTTLLYWNYTLYNNDTISNGSWCQLTAPEHIADDVWPNGTFVNGTSCYIPLDPIGTRAGIGVGFAVAYGICLVLILVNLARHGKLYLPSEKRFYPIGRRWQWYWGSIVCATALISLFFGVDVDRFPLQEVPLIVNVFMWFLMQMATTALVWEAVRHWGSWMERQFIDPDPFVLQQTDRRGMFEFWLPMFFYFWLWMNFFMVIPRDWTPIMLQRAPEQTIDYAVPAATDVRFKIAGFILVICTCTIFVSLWHSVKHYEPLNKGLFDRVIGFLGYVPFRFVLEIPLLIALVGYQILCSFSFRLSPLNAEDTNVIAMYVGGYTPALLILIIQIADGFTRPNEDRELIRQRRERGAAINRDLGVQPKPAWWRRVKGDLPANTMADQVLRNVREIGGGRPTTRHAERLAEQRAAGAAATENDNIEMSHIRRTNSVASSTRRGDAPPPYSPYSGKSDTRRTEHAMQAAAGLLFPNANREQANRGRYTDGEQEHRPSANDRSSSTGSGVSATAPPQQIRSMLDV
jgi:hypothetical protein